MIIDPKWARLVSIYTGAALVKAALFIGAFLLGRRLDQYLGTEPLFIMIGLLTAMGLGTWYVIVITRRRL